MNEKPLLNSRQLTLLVSNLLITKMMFAFPRFLFKTSGNAAWIQAVYVSLIAYILFSLSICFYRYTGNKSILQLAESIGKRPLKIIIAILITLIIAANAATEMRLFTESVKIVLLPKTKIEYIMIFFTVTIIIGAYCGFGSLSVLNALFFPFFLFFIAAMVISLVPTYNINNLFPVFGTGLKNIFIRGLRDTSCFTDLLALNLILPYCNDIDMVKRSGRSAILISGLVLVLICLSYGLTYPYPYSSEFLLVTYQLSRMVRAGEYFERFEALFEFVWTITQLLYSSIYVYILCEVFRNTFKLRFSKPLIPCVAATLSLLSFLPGTIVDLLDSAYGLKERLVPIAYLLPIVMPLLYIITKRKGPHSDKEGQ